ncbi:MAG: PD40 domain-containing protein [Myxococcales bacterium]|nr:PD40 domain-containing protein [Myxococcales bacterium]
MKAIQRFFSPHLSAHSPPRWLRMGGLSLWLFGLMGLLFLGEAQAQDTSKSGILGYYRYPTIHGKNIVFVAEGDLWSVSLDGGLARRLTSHPGSEALPRFSPDGKWLAFSADYEGDSDLYVMSAKGGAPRRLTFRPGADIPVAWTPDSQHIVFMSRRRYHFWNWFLYKVHVSGKKPAVRLPLGHAASLSFAPDGNRVVFNRGFRELRTWKRYTGGWAQDIWFGDLAKQSFRKITTFPGTDVHPMWYKDRIYFVSDRSGTRNLFSMDLDRKKILQHTFHELWDVRWASLGGDRIVYQGGADIWCLDLKTNLTTRVEIRLSTDAIRKRPRYIHGLRYFENHFDLDAKGDRMVLNVRGDIFQVPTKKGGFPVRVTRSSGSREKFASFTPKGDKIVAMSDASGEDEITLYDALGEEKPKQITHGGKVWRFWPSPSPDGKWYLFSDKNLKLWLVDAASGKPQLIDQSETWEIYNYAFSPDSRYVVYVKPENNRFSSIFLYDLKEKVTIRATRSWTNDFAPTFSADGKTLYFISDRSFDPVFGHFDFLDIVDKTSRIYALTLAPKTAAPYPIQDPLVDARGKTEAKATKEAEKAAKEAAKKAEKAATQKAAGPTSKKSSEPKKAEAKAAVEQKPKKKAKKKKHAKKERAKKKKHAKKKVKKCIRKCKKTCKKDCAKTCKEKCKGEKAKKACAKKDKKKSKKKPSVKIEVISKGLEDRAYLLDKIPAGHYFALRAVKGRLFWMSRPTVGVVSRGRWRHPINTLMAYDLKSKKMMPFAPGIHSYDISDDGSKVAIRRGMTFQVASTKAPVAPKGRAGVIDLSSLYKFRIDPAKEWEQILKEAWRLQRDFYWAADMAKIDWKKIGERYFKLLPRILTRGDLNNVIGELIGELGTSHTYVFGGDIRRSQYVAHGVLGADFTRDASGYYKVTHVLRGAPWAQHLASPLAAHHLKIGKGTFILAINGESVKNSTSLFAHLQNTAGKTVMLLVNEKPERKGARRVLVKAIGAWQESRLRYIDWVESRRLLVQKWSKGRVAYLHLPNMSADGLVAFYRMWYPQLHKHALLIDVRGNGGGNVSQILIQKLMRRIWAAFTARNVKTAFWTAPTAAFRGHMAVLTNQNAGSDGDIFCRSFQILKMGKVFGTRTWGGVVGIRGGKYFVDRGLTTQPEFAWWSKQDNWNIENKGVTPDVVVDNLPEDYEKGYDRQLRVITEHLLERLKNKPVPPLRFPAAPDKSVPGFLEKWKRWVQEVQPAPIRLPQDEK